MAPAIFVLAPVYRVGPSRKKNILNVKVFPLLGLPIPDWFFEIFDPIYFTDSKRIDYGSPLGSTRANVRVEYCRELKHSSQFALTFTRPAQFRKTLASSPYCRIGGHKFRFMRRRLVGHRYGEVRALGQFRAHTDKGRFLSPQGPKPTFEIPP